MARATTIERSISKGQLITVDFYQDKVADSQTAVAMNRLEVSIPRVKVTELNGGSAGNHTVTGITTSDTLLYVAHLSTAASIATWEARTGEFTITSTNTINNTSGTDTTNDQLVVFWEDADVSQAVNGVSELLIPFDFEIVAITVSSTEARTAGTLTVDATIDGTVTGLQAALDGTNTTRDSGTQVRGSDTGSAGSRVGVKLTTASWTPTTADVCATLWVIVSLEGI